LVGVEQTVADEMRQWFDSEGSDGFSIMFP